MPEERLLATLDEFSSEATIHEPRAPLVLLGPTGAGKSALLANWLARRAGSSALIERGPSWRPEASGFETLQEHSDSFLTVSP